VTDGLKSLYRQRIRPVEEAYKFGEFYSPLMNDGDFDAKPMVLLIGALTYLDTNPSLVDTNPSLVSFASMQTLHPQMQASILLAKLLLSATCWAAISRDNTSDLNRRPTGSLP